MTADTVRPPSGKVGRGVQRKEGVLALTSLSHPYGTRRTRRRAVSSVFLDALCAEPGGAGTPSVSLTLPSAVDQSRGRPAASLARGRSH